MSEITGTDSRNNIPLNLRFRFGGSDIGWPQPLRINGFANSAESVDGRYRISDLDVYFADISGSYFATQFGNGTRGFGTSLEVIAYLGGTMGYHVQGLNTMWASVGTAGGFAATMHTGRVYGISYANRTLRVRSKTNLALVNELKWQFPLQQYPWNSGQAQWIGSYAFSVGNFATTYLGTTAFYNFNDAKLSWKARAYLLPQLYTMATTVDVVYPQDNTRGTVPINSAFYWAGTDSGGTNFYDVNKHFPVEGTYFGTYVGTIQSDDDARDFGYVDMDEANRLKTNATSYNINKTRIKMNGSNIGSYIHFVSPMTITGSPKDCFKLLMTGAMVTPFFTNSDLDQTTLNQSGTLTAFSYYENTVDFDEDDVSNSIKSVVETTQGLFCVNSSNKFEFRSYGPLNLQQSIASYGTADIISSVFDNLEEDYYNRFIIKYNYDYITNSFKSQHQEKVSAWGKNYDKPLTIESKWIKNPNEAAVIAQRLRVRYENTVPRISFTTNLNRVGWDIGTLLRLTDPNSGISNRILQVVGFNKDWTNKTIEFETLDGDSLYQRKGFAFWDDGTVLPGVAVSGTSTAGWGTNGTVNNINSTIYGSQFSWW